MLPRKLFDQFRQAIASLPTKAENERYEKSELLCERFRLFSEAGLDVYYVPFHYMNRKARVVLLGLTPGWTQMELAFRAAKKALAEGLEGDALFRRVLTTAAFGGSMRKNLVSMLDGIGLNDRLGVGSCLDLFGKSSDLVHFTSAVTAPVFKKGENYAGLSPRLLTLPTMKAFVVEILGAELLLLPEAVIVPLGNVASAAVEFLHAQDLVRLDKCLTDFPHPSGASPLRPLLYKRGCARWRKQLLAWFGSKTPQE